MKALLTVLLAMLITIPMLGQAPPPPPNPAEHAQHHVKMLTTLLSLTAAQQSQATTIFQNAGRAEEPIHQSMKAAHDSLHTAIRNNDSAGIEQAATQIGQYSGQMTAIHAKAEAAFYQILTPEQQTKLSEFESEQKGPFGGPEGMHGPGPHKGMD
jgi:Spy/CpxP family protein refolding chaperone